MSKKSFVISVRLSEDDFMRIRRESLLNKQRISNYVKEKLL